MMPLSYQSIGFTFIFLMVVFLMISELFRYIKGQIKKSARHSQFFKEKIGGDSVS